MFEHTSAEKKTIKCRIPTSIIFDMSCTMNPERLQMHTQMMAALKEALARSIDSSSDTVCLVDPETFCDL